MPEINYSEATRISQLEIELSAVKEKISFFSVIYSKFDATLEKVQTMIENRRQDTNDDLKEVYDRIDMVETKIMNEIKRLREDMLDQHEIEKRKIEDLNKWRWIVMGAAAVVGWIVSKMFTGK
jgi:vacuolar-type H+-ATPase subunit I/STV1